MTTPRPILTAVFREGGAARMLLRFQGDYPVEEDRWITVRVRGDTTGPGGTWEGAARDVAALSDAACALLWESAEPARLHVAREG